MNGLLDFVKTPAGQGLLSGLFGYAANARRGTPINNLGRGGIAGMIGYSNAIEGQKADEEAQVTKQFRTLQMDNYRSEMDERKRKLDEEAAKKVGLQNFVQAVDPTRAAMADGRGPTLQNAGRMPDQRSAMYFEMLRNGLISAPDYLSAVGPKDPKVKDYKEVRNADGSVSYVGLTEDGKVIDTKQTPFKAPEVRDFGGYVGGVDPITGKVSKFGDKTIDPGTRASNAVAWANYNLGRDRYNFEVEKDQRGTFSPEAGGFVTPPTRTSPGQVVPVPGFQPKLTEGQAKAYQFGTRADNSNSVLERIFTESKVDKPGRIKATTEATFGMVPFIGDKLADNAGAVLNWTQSAEQQQVEQAQRDFINAILRRESGAVISPQEFANAEKQYFPQIGDDEKTTQQKRENRRIAIQGIYADVPPSMRQVPPKPGVPAQTQASQQPSPLQFSDPAKESRYLQWKRQHGAAQ